jgi:hypothetical protein
MFLVTALVSTNVWALTWDPDAEATLGFNMNFETHTSYTTTDAEAGTVGTLKDYNTAPLVNPTLWDPNRFWEITNGIRGTSANFDHLNDRYPWGKCPNDVNITIAGTYSQVFELGLTSDKHSFAFWFNDVDINEPGAPDPCAPDPNWPLSLDPRAPGYMCQRELGKSTFISYAHRWAYQPDYSKFWWEIRINAGKLEVREGEGHINMVTTDPLSLVGAPKVPDNNGWIDPTSTGVDPNTWHHAIVVVDRSTKTASKIYIDGLEVPVTIIGCNDEAASYVDAQAKSPVRIGTGEFEFDGMLDDVRIYDKALNPLEACVLYQYNVADINAIALNPLLREEDVSMITSLDWDPAPGATKQEIYFGKDNPPLTKKVTYYNGTGNTVAYTSLNGGIPLELNTKYYWQVKSTIGTVRTGHVWSFTTESGKAEVVSPLNGQQDTDNSGTTDLLWTTSMPGGRNFDVYFGEAADALDRLEPNNITATQVDNVPTILTGKTYYWRVNTLYTDFEPDVNVQGDVWSFRTEAKKIIFNTDDNDVNYITNYPIPNAGRIIQGRTCDIKLPNNVWTDNIATGCTLGTDGVARFTFAAFDYDSAYDIVVVPDYFADGANNNDNAAPPTPLGIQVTNDFYFNGKMDISGDNSYPLNPNASPKARSGGHRGARKEVTEGDFGPEYKLGYYYKKMEFESRWGDERAHWYSVPTTINFDPPVNEGGGGTGLRPDRLSGYSVFGLGCSKSAPYKDSGGAGYGGIGGDSGRGFTHGIFTGGASYGDEEVPVPFGGSAASWSQNASGGAGGGGVEITAANVELGDNAQILSRGGSHTWKVPKYPAGGGSGGSVKVVTAGNFINGGTIDVSGGRGQDGGEKANNAGGGGGGGRVAVFYGGTCTQGTIIATGGDCGVTLQGSPGDEGLGRATPGGDGTIYVVGYTGDTNDPNSPKKASAPTPRDGDTKVYAAGSQVTLKWYSGYGTTGTDQVYFGEVGGPNTTKGAPEARTRGQHTCDVTPTVDAGDPENQGKSYYWYVLTTDGAEVVKSDVWTFSPVYWECLEPDWFAYTGQTLDTGNATMMLKAGWPAYDQNHDCIVDNLDFWYFAKEWYVNRGESYKFDTESLDQFVSEWMTCRARTNDGCYGWPKTADWVPPSTSPL